MPVSIADLFVTVGADVSGAQSGLTQIGNQLDQTTRQFQAAAPAALVLAGAGAAIEAGFVGATKVAADFEKQMSGVRAVMTPTEARQFGAALDDLSLKLGADTSFSARQAAAGIEELIKAGIPAQAVLEGAGKAALDLAAATGTDVANAATIAAQAMNAFKIPVSQLPTIVDRLAGVVNVSAADMSDLRFGLQSVGAVAATVGLSFEDTTAALGIFANNGLRGQDAGTSLKTMLLNLQPSTKAQAAEFKRLGLVTADGANAFFDAQGHAKGLAGISGTLQNALKGMTDQQKLASLEVLFGSDAMRAAAILAKTGANGVNEFTEQVRQVSAADQAAERLNNLLGRLEQLGGSFETVQIIIGRFFLPAVGAIADVVKGALNAFSNMTPVAQGLVTAVLAIGGAGASLTGAMVLLTPIARTLGPSFAALGSILLRVAPFFLRLAGVAGILFAAWQANLFGIRDLVARAFNAIPGILDRVGSVLSQAGTLWEQSILPAIQTIGNEIERRLIPVFNDIVTNPVFTRIQGILGNVGLVFQKVLAGDIAGAFDTFRAIIGAIAPGAAGFMDLIGRLADGLGRFAGGVGQGLLTFFTETLPPILDTIGQFKDDVGARLLGFFSDVVVPIADAAARFAGDIGAGLTTFFTQTLPPIIENIGGFTGGVGDAMLTFFRDTLGPIAVAAGQFAGEVGSGLVTFFTVTLPPVIEKIGSFSFDAVQPLVAFFNDHVPVIVDAVGKFAGDIGAGMVKFFTVDLPPAIDTAGHVTGDTFKALVDFFETSAPLIIGGANRFAQAQTQPFIDFFAQFDAVRAQVESLGPLFTSFNNFVQSIQNLLAAITQVEAQSVGAIIGTEFDFLGAALGRFQPIADAAKPSLDAIAGTVQTLGDRLSGVTDFFNNAATAFNNLADAVRNLGTVDLTGVRALLGLPIGSTAPGGPGAGAATLTNTSFVPAGSGGAGTTIAGPLIGQIIVTNEADEDRLVDKLAQMLDAAANRITAPVPNPGVPQLEAL